MEYEALKLSSGLTSLEAYRFDVVRTSAGDEREDYYLYLVTAASFRSWARRVHARILIEEIQLPRTAPSEQPRDSAAG